MDVYLYITTSYYSVSLLYSDLYSDMNILVFFEKQQILFACNVMT